MRVRVRMQDERHEALCLLFKYTVIPSAKALTGRGK